MKRTSVLALVSLGLAACQDAPPPTGPTQELQPTVRAAMAVQDFHSERLMAEPGVMGTATGFTEDGIPAVVVLVHRDQQLPPLPYTMDGVPVLIREVDEILSLGVSSARVVRKKAKIDPKRRFDRPVPIGVSTGNAGECSSGTIGARVTDAGSNVYALSNNHVYALENSAPIGSTVLQPGLFDTRCRFKTENVFGSLAAFEPIVFSTSASNKIDAAIASVDPGDLDNATPENGYGTPNSTTAAAFVGMAVQKYGRTTSLTQGTVTMINVTVLVGYDAGTAQFVDQIIVESNDPVIEGGDSGSLLVTDDADANPVGLLYAGTPDGRLAVANRIDLVLAEFGVTIDGEGGPPPPPPAPVADFSGSPTSGSAPLAVQFTDLSSNTPPSWSWDFGDGNTSTEQNPSHTYTSAGSFTVSLTATNAGGSDSETKADYITVSAGGTDQVTITKAEYRQSSEELKVEATSTDLSATLTVEGLDENGDVIANYGIMDFDAKKGKWKLRVRPVSPGPTSVRVTSSVGGSATSAVTFR